MRAAASLSGLPATLRAAVRAGLVVGVVFGLTDGVVAAVLGTAALGPVSLAGCLAAAVFEYSAFSIAVASAVALVLHPALGRWSPTARLQGLLALGFTLGAFAELFWWTRPWILYGRPWHHPGRLAAAPAMLVAAALLARVLARPLAERVTSLGWRLLAPLALLALAGGGYVLAQRDVLRGHGEPNERTRDMPSVLLVVVDALRQDTLGCYGHPRVRTPNVDRLAREGVLFENAFTQAPFTWTSFGSLLTGKYPRRHGLVRMAPGARMVPNVTLASLLESGRRRDGRQLSDSDYLSASFHTGTLSTGSGLLQGFDLYYEEMAGHELVVTESAWSVFRSDLLLHVLRAKLAQKSGGDVAGTARAWLAEHGRSRFFAMVHLYSTHTPYDPPEEFRRMYVDPAYAGPLRAFYAEHREAIERGEAQPTEADVAHIRDLYYAGVSEADAALGGLLAELERLRALDDTLVIVTADHGESLGEQGLWEHNHMVQTNLRIPLVMRWPRSLPVGRRVAAAVDEIDVLPTVCDLLGLELPEVRDPAHDTVDGASLLPVVRGEAQSVRPLSFAENGLFLSAQDGRWKLIVPVDLLEPAAWARGVDARGARPTLFDLQGDGGELRDVLAEQRAEAERLVAALRAWNAAMPIPRMELSARDLESIERFKALGYAGGVGADLPPGR
jgi:arylsulfatase A-like enzyme